VVAHSGADAVLVLGRDELERIGGDLEAFAVALEERRDAAGLVWPG
jgi:hypothetical protein